MRSKRFIVIFIILVVGFSCTRSGKIEGILVNEKGWRPYRSEPLDNSNTEGASHQHAETSIVYYFKANHRFEMNHDDGKVEQGKWNLKGSQLNLDFADIHVHFIIRSISRDEIGWVSCNSKGEMMSWVKIMVFLRPE